jgi:hypothetical protein
MSVQVCLLNNKTHESPLTLTILAKCGGDHHTETTFVVEFLMIQQYLIVKDFVKNPDMNRLLDFQ